MAQEASTTARSIVNMKEMKEEHQQILLDRMGRRAGNAINLLEKLYFRPIITVEQVQEIVNLSYPNANTLVKDICELGILQEVTGQKRNRAFAYQPFLKIFQD